MHQTKDFNYNDKPIKNLHKWLNDRIGAALSAGVALEMPAEMTRKLKNDIFVFSGMKTYAELKEASGLLLNDDGTVKPFAKFSEDVKKINNTYNKSYLEAEYNFAVAGAQQAANWANIDQSKELQYRTAEDDRVRPEHAALDKITLPATNDFWNRYYPPNGWNCRCVAIEVNAGKYDQSNSQEAEKLGQAATVQIDKNGNNAAAIFRFNPGKQEVVFPPTHPYYAQHCSGAKLNLTGLLGKSRIVLANEEEKCAWQNELKKNMDDIAIKSYANGGDIIKSPLVNTTNNDYNAVVEAADHFAKQGEKTEILPKIHVKDPLYDKYFSGLKGTEYEGKNPDFKVNNLYYEHEGFVSENSKKAFKNMMNRGLKQSSRIVIEDAGVTDDFIRRSAINRLRQGQKIDEIWIKNGKQLRLIFKSNASEQ